MHSKYIFIALIVCSLYACKSKQVVSESNYSKPSAAKNISINPTRNGSEFDYYFYEGIRFKEDSQFDKAIELFDMCYSIDSTDVGLQSELGQMYLLTGLNNRGIGLMAKAVKNDPSNWWYSTALINIYIESKQLAKAVKVAEDLKKYHSKNEDLYRLLAMLYKNTEQNEAAIQAYTDLEEIAGVSEEIVLEKLQLYVLLGKSKKAIQELDLLVAKYPHVSEYQVLRADVYLQENNFEKAYAIYQNVVQTDPQNANVYLSLSEYYNKQNKPNLAHSCIVKALTNDNFDIKSKLSVLTTYSKDYLKDSTKYEQTDSLFQILTDKYPLEIDVHGYYSKFLEYINRPDEAITEVETMVSLNEKLLNNWFWLINLKIRNEKLDDAISTCNKALILYPTIDQFYFFKGLSFFQKKNNDDALKAFKQGLMLVNPQDIARLGDYYSILGDLYYKLEQKDSAFANYEKALSILPDNLMLMNNYAYYLSLSNKDLSKAERLSAKTVELEPTNPTFLDTYAWIFYLQKNYFLAKFYIEKAISNLKKNEDNSVVYDHCGDIYWMYAASSSSYESKALEMWVKAKNAGLNTPELEKKIINKGWDRTK